MKRFKQGKFKPTNKTKYIGNAKEVIYRSSWELAAFKYLDGHKNVRAWSSEEIVIPYYLPLDKKMHRYFPDLFVETTDGRKYIVEIKPKREQKRPVKTPKKKRKTYLRESVNFVRNKSKWEAANEFAEANGMTFQIWNEDVLKGMGLL